MTKIFNLKGESGMRVSESFLSFNSFEDLYSSKLSIPGNYFYGLFHRFREGSLKSGDFLKFNCESLDTDFKDSLSLLGFHSFNKGDSILFYGDKFYKKMVGSNLFLEELSYSNFGVALDFLKGYFNNLGFNFLSEVDKNFLFNSRSYLLFDKSDSIVGFGRNCWKLKNSKIPLEFALIQKSGSVFRFQSLFDEDGSNLCKNSSQIRFLESMIVYDSSKIYGRDFLKVNAVLSSLLASQFLLSSFPVLGFTTFESKNFSAKKNLLQRLKYRVCYGYDDKEIVLKYGNFGGDWNLVYLDKLGAKKIVKNFSRLYR